MFNCPTFYISTKPQFLFTNLYHPNIYPIYHYLFKPQFKSTPKNIHMRDNDRRQNRGGDRRGGRFGDRRRNGPRDEGSFRKGSRDFNNRRGGDRDTDDRKTKGISRDGQGKGRGPRDHKRQDDRKPKDLDGELMNYWIKSGKQDPEGKNVAQQKLNEDMDNYWNQKAAEEKVEQKPQQQ